MLSINIFASEENTVTMMEITHSFNVISHSYPKMSNVQTIKGVLHCFNFLCKHGLAMSVEITWAWSCEGFMSLWKHNMKGSKDGDPVDSMDLPSAAKI